MIEVPTFIDIVDFLGPKDAYLLLVKKQCDVRAKLEGRNLYVFGDEAKVSRAVLVLEKMLEVLGTGEKVLEQDVDLYLRQSEQGHITETSNDVLLKMGKTVVKAKTPHQKEYADAIENNIITFAIGPSGTAKTYLAVTQAIKAFLEKKIEKIVITRSPIPLSGMDLGFLPGTSNDKMMPYVAPLTNVFLEFFTPEKFKTLLDADKISIVPLAYIRGYSLKNSFVIVDEAQNLGIDGFKSIMTRLGVGSKLVICGDECQSDIGSRSGLEKAASIMQTADGVSVIRMSEEDIVRSGIVAEVIRRFSEAGY